MNFLQSILLSAFLIFNLSLAEESKRLLLVQTLFRHSDRAPVYLYPNDPNDPFKAWPLGLGELTTLGRKQHYRVGQYLRSMYGDFITTNPREVYANSSSEGRCLDSATVNLAAFFAPEKEFQFEKDLDWQPITVHYLPFEIDQYLNWDISCPSADREDSLLQNSKEIKDLYETHQDMVKNVSKLAGVDYTDGVTPLFLYDTLKVEKIHNLIIPDWVDTYWDELEEIGLAMFRTFFSSFVQLRLRVGPFMEIISKNFMEKINGYTHDLKVVMNAAHDINVAGVLLALNITDMPRPPYCAMLLFELHEMSDDSKAVRLLYLNSTNPLDDIGEPHVLKLNNCSEFCPIEKFINSYQSLIPNNWLEECQVLTPDSTEDR